MLLCCLHTNTCMLPFKIQFEEGDFLTSRVFSWQKLSLIEDKKIRLTTLCCGYKGFFVLSKFNKYLNQFIASYLVYRMENC